MLLFVMGTWEAQSWEKRVSVAVLMPSGIGETTDDPTLRVSDDGNYFELSRKMASEYDRFRCASPIMDRK